MSTVLDLTTMSDQDLQQHFSACVTNSDTNEIARTGQEINKRWLAQQRKQKQPATSQQQAAPVVKLKFEKPEVFDGTASRVSDFLFSVEQYLHNVGEHDPIRQQRFASSLLVKRALTWWRTKCTNNVGWHSRCTFSQFIVDLRADFRDVNHDQRVRQQLFSLCMSPKDTVQYYVQRFRTLYTELGSSKPDADTLLYQFIQGLTPEIRFQLDLQPPATLSDAELKAEHVYQAIRLWQGQPRPFPNPGNQTTASSSSRTPRGAPMELGTAHTTPSQPARKNFTCYRCGKPGHTARYCRAPAPLAPQQHNRAASQGAPPQGDSASQSQGASPSHRPRGSRGRSRGKGATSYMPKN